MARCRTCGMACAGDYCNSACFRIRWETLPEERLRGPRRAAVALAKYYTMYRVGKA